MTFDRPKEQKKLEREIDLLSIDNSLQKARELAERVAKSADDEEEKELFPSKYTNSPFVNDELFRDINMLNYEPTEENLDMEGTIERESAKDFQRQAYEKELQKSFEKQEKLKSELNDTMKQLKVAKYQLISYQTLFKFIPYPCFFIRPDLMIIKESNDAATTFTSRHRDDLAGSTFTAYVRQEDRPAFRSFILGLFNKTNAIIELTLEVSGQPPKLVSMHGSLVSDEDHVYGVMLVIDEMDKALI